MTVASSSLQLPHACHRCTRIIHVRCSTVTATGCWLSSGGLFNAEALQEAQGPDPLLSLLSSTPRPRRKSDTSTRPGHLPPIMHRHPPEPVQPPPRPQVCCLTAQGVASCTARPLQPSVNSVRRRLSHCSLLQSNIFLCQCSHPAELQVCSVTASCVACHPASCPAELQ